MSRYWSVVMDVSLGLLAIGLAAMASSMCFLIMVLTVKAALAAVR